MEKKTTSGWGTLPASIKTPGTAKPKTDVFISKGETRTATYERQFTMNWGSGRVRARSVGLRHETPRTEVTMNLGTNERTTRTLPSLVTYDSRQHHRENGPWHAPTSDAPIADRSTTTRIARGTAIGTDANGDDHPVIGRLAL